MQFSVFRKQIGVGKYKYEVCDSNGEIGYAGVTERCSDHIVVTVAFRDTKASISIMRSFGPQTKTNDGVQSNTGSFIIDGMNGEVFRCSKSGRHFFNGILYEKYCLSGEEYKAYEVGLGRKGIYLCVWAQDSIVAEISKDPVMKSFECSYEVYSDGTISEALLFLMCVYWDLTKYYPRGAANQRFVLNTWQKEMKNKYDPDFINRVSRQFD